MRTCSTCALIVVEPTSHFAPVLRSILKERNLRVVECRSLADCETWLAAFPWSVLAVTATAENSSLVVAFLRTLRERFDHAWGVGLVPVEAVALEPLLREAGAVEVLCSVVQAERLAHLVLRQAARAPRQTCAEEAWLAARLPWGTKVPPEGGG